MSSTESNRNEVDLISALFRALRGKTGLTAARLAARRRDADALLRSGAVLATSRDPKRDPYGAAVDAVREAALHLNATDLLVADAALRLETLERLAQGLSLEMKIPAMLYALSLDERRGALIGYWRQLHEFLVALGFSTGTLADQPPPKSRLRAHNGLEDQAFERLARMIVEAPRTPEGRQAKISASARPERIEPLMLEDRQAIAVVLGAAVMDAIFVIDQMPPEDHSRQVSEFYLHPGGKGLVQAVAATRLGMKTSLVTAVGCRPFGPDIVEYLARRGVDLDFVDQREAERSPVTGVIVLDEADGATMALGWKGDQHLSPEVFTDARYLELLRSADVLFVTFEPPLELVERVLNICASLEDENRKPLVVLTPAPPYDLQLPSGRGLAAVDIIVANQWELERVLTRGQGRLNSKETVRRLLGANVNAICLFDLSGVCTVNGREVFIQRKPMTVPQRGAAGARDAFCAALAFQLLSGSGDIDEESIRFAMAAWCASIREVAVPESMPYLGDIYSVLAADSEGAGSE